MFQGRCQYQHQSQQPKRRHSTYLTRLNTIGLLAGLVYVIVVVFVVVVMWWKLQGKHPSISIGSQSHSRSFLFVSSFTTTTSLSSSPVWFLKATAFRHRLVTGTPQFQFQCRQLTISASASASTPTLPSNANNIRCSSISLSTSTSTSTSISISKLANLDTNINNNTTSSINETFHSTSSLNESNETPPLPTKTEIPTSKSTINKNQHQYIKLPKTQNGLVPPTIIYQNNHLLVIDKPPGWHSMPNTADLSKSSLPSTLNNNQNNQNSNSKCLLSYLQQQLLGGGSTKTFLIPLHRLDQPCSGLLLFGKTSKAASRIQSNFNSIVTKTYLIIIPVVLQQASLSKSKSSPKSSSFLTNLQFLQQYSQPIKTMTSTIPTSNTNNHNNEWMELKAYLEKKPKRVINYSTNNNRRSSSSSSSRNNNNNRGWSVQMIPFHKLPNTEQTQQNYRLCSLRYRILSSQGTTQRSSNDNINIKSNSKNLQFSYNNNNNNNNYNVLEVQTQEGSKHMIRATFACYGCPLAGDVRYGRSTSTSTTATQALPDQSVALHAYTITLSDTLQLGDAFTGRQKTIVKSTAQSDGVPITDTKSTVPTLPEQRSYCAPIPQTWKQYFGISI